MVETQKYQDFNNNKKRKREIKNKFPENWIFGPDSVLYKTTGKNPKKVQLKKPPRSNISLAESSGLFKKSIDGINPNKKKLIIRETNPPVKTLEDWNSMYAPCGSESDLKREITNEMTNIVKGRINSDNNNNNNNRITGKKKRVKEKTEKAEKIEDIDNFFLYDKNDEKFGLKEADYLMVSNILEDIREKDVFFDEFGRTDFNEKTSQDVLLLPDLEICDFAYCAKFQREPENNFERQCRNGKKCVYKILASRSPIGIGDDGPEDGFVCKEFLLPSQFEVFEKTKQLPIENRLCLGCNRFTTYNHYLYYQQKRVQPTEILQDHQNPIDINEGYCSSACIYPNPDNRQFTGIVRPIVKFNKNNIIFANFKCQGSKKTKCIIECNVMYEEAVPRSDFR